MSVWLRFGRDRLRLDLLERWRRPPVVAPQRGALRAVIREASGADAERENLPVRVAVGAPHGFESARRICLVIPDATRRGPWQTYRDPVIRWVEEVTPKAERRAIVVASGIHRPAIPDGLADLSGWSVVANGANGYVGHREVGRTPNGTVVRLHSDYVEADARIVLGDLSFHYFAGFGGGRKLIFPGLGEPGGILANHRRCLDAEGRLRAECEPGRLDGNPVHEDLMAAVSLSPPHLLLQAHEPSPGERAVLTAGDWIATHERGCAAYLRGHILRFTQRPDILIADAGGFPRDASVLQAHKSLQHAARFLNPGDKLLLVAGLEEGSGSETLERLWRLEPEDLRRRAVESYEPHTHTALALKTVCRGFEVGVWSRMGPEFFAGMGVTPIADEADALRWLEEAGRPRQWGWLTRAEEVLPQLVGWRDRPEEEATR